MMMGGSHFFTKEKRKKESVIKISFLFMFVDIRERIVSLPLRKYTFVHQDYNTGYGIEYVIFFNDVEMI